MLRKLAIFVALGAGLIATSCSKDYCADLAGKVCKQAPDTKACQKAKTLTNKTTCKGYLSDVNGFIKLTNLKVTKPPLKPPAKVAKKVKAVKKVQPRPAEAPKPDAATAAQAKDVQKSATAPKNQAEKPATPPKDQQKKADQKQPAK